MGYALLAASAALLEGARPATNRRAPAPRRRIPRRGARGTRASTAADVVLRRCRRRSARGVSVSSSRTRKEPDRQRASRRVEPRSCRRSAPDRSRSTASRPPMKRTSSVTSDTFSIRESRRSRRRTSGRRRWHALPAAAIRRAAVSLHRAKSSRRSSTDAQRVVASGSRPTGTTARWSAWLPVSGFLQPCEERSDHKARDRSSTSRTTPASPPGRATK